MLFSQSDEVFLIVDEPPRFPGCENITNNDEERDACSKRKLLEYIYGNLKYPEEARKQNIEGRVIAQFVIKKDGSITDITLIRDVEGGCGQATIEVLESMNENNIKWIPGKQSGGAVRVKYTLPVIFKLEGDKKK